VKRTAWEFALLFVLGGLITVAVGVCYHVIDWVFARQFMVDYNDDHTRGLWEGAMSVVVFEGGRKIAHRIAAARRKQLDETT